MQDYSISFNEWIKGKTGRTYLRVCGVFAFLYSILTVANSLKLGLPENISILNISSQQIEAFTYIIQIVFISFVVLTGAFKYLKIQQPAETAEGEIKVWGPLRLHKTELQEPHTEEDKKALWVTFKKDVNKSARQFVVFWASCWIAWLVFYIIFATVNYDSKFSQSILNFANNINALLFLFLFMTLSVSTSKYGIFQWARFGLVVIGIYFLNVACEGNKNASFGFSLFSGLFAGMSMAAFIGSINSRTISIPIWVLLLLHLYCAIQPLYIFFKRIYYFATNIQI